jgi:predicted P-loop ATPase
VFAGSTNREKFLRDTTGNRRFLPVPTPKIDIEALKRDRAMIFAEAVAMFKKGEHWWPDRDFERAHFVPRQEERVEIDDWEQPIKEWLEIGPTHSATAFEIMRDALHLLTAQINPQGRRVADIMRKLG